MSKAFYKIEFYVPESHLDSVKAALFEAGAGKLGNYDSCAWQTQGLGQYRPLQGSEPFHGQKGVTETVKECKVELVCDCEYLPAAIQGLLKSHPYEEPAYSYIKVLSGPYEAC